MNFSNNHEEKNNETPNIKNCSKCLLQESKRLATFHSCWSCTFISPEELAKWGFFFVGSSDKKDRVQCIFCNGIIQDWEPKDTPEKEHRFHFPNCDFIRNQPVGNVPLESSIADIPSNTSYTDVCGGFIRPHSQPEKLPKQLREPREPKFSTYMERLQSFKNWPKGLAQTPRQCSEAGFYYSGIADFVRCFYCGGGLKNWEPTHDVWIEHIKWYPTCEFLIEKKGKKFIHAVALLYLIDI